MKQIVLTSLLALGMSTGAASAQQAAYSTEELVDYFINSIDMGTARGICIGTPQECAPEEPKGLDMMVTFELDSSELTPQARENLAVFATMMKDERLMVARFKVEGHTDARGTEAYNDGLSAERAASVRKFLIDQGITPERLEAIGYGWDQPRTDDPLDDANRRVELRVSLN